MKKTNIFLAIVWLLFSFCDVCVAQNNSGVIADKKVSFSFSLNKKSTTSAGVYKKDETLVRTLWGNVKYDKGLHTVNWDGKDDFGKNIFDTSLVYKVLSNNVKYNWDGVIGNTSASFTGSGIYHAYDLIKSMAITGDNAYMGVGYNEAWPSKQKISLKKPQSQNAVLFSGQGTAQRTNYVTTDGVNVYWGENDPYSPTDREDSKGFKWFVIATKVTTDLQVSFSTGVSIKSTYGLNFTSAIDVLDNNQSALGNIRAISGLAVQKSGRFLFVAHGAMNKLHVFDKTTGILIKALSFTNPREVSVDDNGNLWMISAANTVARYAINTDGSLQSASLSLSGLETPQTLGVSVDGKIIAIIDGGLQQQIKAFNAISGANAWTLGQQGGYALNANVANDKFMFGGKPFISFQGDGSFWFADEGNNRYQHFSSSLAFIENIAYLPVTYCISVDENDPTRVFSGFLEFAIDYSKPLAPDNGSWKLVKNWAYTAPETADRFESLKTTFTLKNGRTYSVIRDGIDYMELVELVNGGNMRRTGLKHDPEYWLSADGSLQKQWAPHYSGGYSVWVKKPLIGFNALNNPIWGNEFESDRVAISDTDPAYRGQGPTYKPAEITSTGVRPNFDGGNKNIPFHLGGVKNGKMIWKTARSTNYTYTGGFPTNGDFDIGNGVSDFAGSNALAIDRSIFWGYHGEFWKSGQANVWNHIYDNGLMIGQFGTSDGAYKEGYPAMAGNAFSTKVVKVGQDYYLYHNDESYHSGVHRFKISGINTIEEQTIAVKDTEAAAPDPNGLDLMAGLPFNKVLANGTNGWSRSSINETANFSATTSVKTYNPANGDDIYMNFSEGKGNCNIIRDLGINKGLEGWKLAGNITWAGGMPNYTNGGGGVFLEVLDDAGKVITRFCFTTAYGNDVGHIMGNNIDILSGETDNIQNDFAAKVLPVEISVSKGVFTFQYGEYSAVTNSILDAAANWQNPKSMRIKFVEDNVVHTPKTFDVANMYFLKVPGQNNVVVNAQSDDLMSGLPYKASMPMVNGWKRSTPNDTYNFVAKTSITTNNTDNGDDIFINFKEGAGDHNITRDLGTNVGLLKWNITGKVTWAGSVPNYTNGNGGVFFEILDDKGKAISKFYYTTNYGTSSTKVKGNDQVITSGDISFLQGNVAALLLPLDIAVNNGKITFTYGDFAPVTTLVVADAGANWQNPQTLRVSFKEDQVIHADKTFDIANMRFVKPVASYTTVATNYFRTKASGDWNNAATWESSADTLHWYDAILAPDTLANIIQVRDNHNVKINGTQQVDQLVINQGGTVNVQPGASIIISNGPGDDVTINEGGSLVIKSDAIGTGIIGNSAGNVKGKVTVERYLPAKANATYRMLAPSVNSTLAIKDNWQAGTNNTSTQINLNPKPGYGTHITGSVNGLNGFDASLTGEASLFTFNWLTSTPLWVPIGNTNTNRLDAKTGYLLFVRGDRGIDITKDLKQSTSTTLSATGTVLMGNVNFTALLGDGKNSAITNPYASPIDWRKLQAANGTQFENYYTMWDPNIGSKGGYVTVDATGTRSVRTSEATTDIQTGQAFIVKTKAAVKSPNFLITETDKTTGNNPHVFRTSQTPIPNLYASLYYLDDNGNRKLADGVLSRFDNSYMSGIDGDDAGDISNFDENLSWKRNGQDLSIESRPLPQEKDTLFLSMNNMKQQAYEWQFNLSYFDPTQKFRAFLRDNYFGKEIPIEMDGSTVIIFAITSDPKSSDPNRFKIVFTELRTLPVNLLSFNVVKLSYGVQVDWKTTSEVDMESYVVEKSNDSRIFQPLTTVKASGGITNKYNFLDIQPGNGNNYYRVKMVSKNGEVQYSAVMVVKIVEANSSFNIVQNPVTGNVVTLKLNNMKPGQFAIQLFNMNGQLVVKSSIQNSTGINLYKINLGNLQAGVYKMVLVNNGEVNVGSLSKL